MAAQRMTIVAVAGLLAAGPAASQGARTTVPAERAPDWKQAIASTLGRRGEDRAGDVYRVSLPRTDLKVAVDGIPIRPAFALGSWVAFVPRGREVELMGDLVLLEREIAPVMRRLGEDGLEVTALHNHLLRAEPSTMYLHVAGHGQPEHVAAALRRALQETGTPLQDARPSPAAASGDGRVDPDAISHALGQQGVGSGDVYQVSIPRGERITEHGMEVPNAMGLASAINFQPAGDGRVATTGDLVLTADEVVPVQRVLLANGIEVTAIHSHMLHEEPRLLFMHFWGTGEDRQLAQGLHAALDETKRQRP
jgi:hypothetical protein